eukprot:3601357-Rhodomonas_salina.2
MRTAAVQSSSGVGAYPGGTEPSFARPRDPYMRPLRAILEATDSNLQHNLDRPDRSQNHWEEHMLIRHSFVSDWPTLPTRTQ